MLLLLKWREMGSCESSQFQELMRPQPGPELFYSICLGFSVKISFTSHIKSFLVQENPSSSAYVQ